MCLCVHVCSFPAKGAFLVGGSEVAGVGDGGGAEGPNASICLCISTPSGEDEKQTASRLTF